LRVTPVPGGPISDRLGPELLLRDRLPLGEAPPPDASVLLTVPWHYADRAVGVQGEVGGGRLVHLGLGWTPQVFADPAFEQLVYRCLLAAATLAPAPRLGVGLYGFGAIARDHADAVEATEGLELRGICDLSPQRRAEAAGLFKVPVHARAGELLSDPGVDIVVVGVPPAQHSNAVLECLEAGKHVVCEKPFALRSEEVERMLAAAARAGRVVTVYQSRRWDPDFVALQAAVRRGAVGEPFYLEAFVGGYGHPCSYWHSHEPISGGTIYDWGSHYFDWILQLFEGRQVVSVSAQSHKRVWHDVTNADQVRVDVTFAGGEQASFLHSDLAAALKPKWYLLGTGGAAVGEWRRHSVLARGWTGELIEDRLEPADAPAALALHRPDGAGGVHVESLSLPARTEHGFYRNLADHLLLGEPLAVPPEQAARNVAVMEAATRSMAAGGRPVDVRI
ncbi:MAG: Gfo/Idh/MocA family oxidoreductase, partial [Candidatus Dormibacteraeota bacterium]|nr:Gfo/Idh/MocA family oxidoreductase [Candidatus Dormibacteraeota bacterium]